MGRTLGGGDVHGSRLKHSRDTHLHQYHTGTCTGQVLALYWHGDHRPQLDTWRFAVRSSPEAGTNLHASILPSCPCANVGGHPGGGCCYRLKENCYSNRSFGKCDSSTAQQVVMGTVPSTQLLKICW